MADESLRKEIQEAYPDIWERVQNRRAYIQKELGITLCDEIIPTSSATAYLRPFMLDKTLALTAK